MKQIVRITENDLINIIKETVNQLKNKRLYNESYNELRNTLDYDDNASGTSVFGQDMANRVKQSRLQEITRHINKVETMCQELVSPSRLDVDTVMEFLPLYLGDLENTLQSMRLQPRYLAKVKNEWEQAQNAHQQGNAEGVTDHGENMAIFMDALKNEIINSFS